MNGENTELFPGKLETADVSTEQVRQEQGAEQVTAWKNRNAEFGTGRRPVNEETFEVAGLSLVQAFVHLRERSDEHEYDRKSQQHDGEPERIQDFEKTIKHLEIEFPARTSQTFASLFRRPARRP